MLQTVGLSSLSCFTWSQALITRDVVPSLNIYWSLLLRTVQLMLISPPGIAMRNGLYFTAVVFSSFFLSFFRCLISEVIERISTKLEHVFTYDCYLKNLVRTRRAFTPMGLRAKTAFLGPTSNFDQKYLCNRKWHQQSERNLSIYRDSPTCQPNLVKFGPQMVENGWRVFAHLVKFARRTSCRLTFRFNHIRLIAPMVNADANSLVSIGEATRRAGYAELCHASS